MATLTPEERESKVATKEQEESQKEAEKKEQKEAEKSEHEDKYFVVHGGTCVCDKAVDPTKEAEIVVTANTKLILNEDAKKFAATEDDKTMKPPTATFGKCKLKPSNSDYLPCAPAFAPKWEKVYDKKTVDGKKILTELSTLQCTVGGKISIKKHGQENSVVKEHAENTDPAEQEMVNPAVATPPTAIKYPSVSSIDLKTIKARTNFIEVKSSGTAAVEKVTLRQNEEATFKAKVKSGNVSLTSWVIYEVKAGKVGKKLATLEQKGTTFQNIFASLGTFRIEGYGQPKTAEHNNGKNDKNYPSCSIDVEVIINKLDGTKLQPKGGDAFTRVKKGANTLRKGYPATFEAKFLLEPTSEEIQNLKMYVTDASGNVLTDAQQSGNIFTFTPPNSNGKYTLQAVYTNLEGTVETQSFNGTTESTYVNSISHGAEVIRPETPMKFNVSGTQFKNTGNLTSGEAATVKWNLNGQPVGTGSSITIPGVYFLKEGKYVVEAYVNTANATGANAKKEDDDWHFEVKQNDVVSFVYVGEPKVGKTSQLKVDKFLMDPIAGEKVVWNIFGLTLENSSNKNPVIDITPRTAGKEKVTCKINNKKGVTLTIDIKQAEITDAMFTDANGIKIEKASWDQKVNIYINQKHLLNEELMIGIVSKESKKIIFSKKITKFDGKVLPVKLDKTIKANAGTETNFYIDVDVPKLKALNDEYFFPLSGKTLEITDKITFSNAIIGEEDGSKKHTLVDYDDVSWFYASTTGIKVGTKLKMEVWQSVTGLDDDMKLPLKPLIDESGFLKAKIQWNKIPKIKSSRIVYIQIKDENDKVLYDADGSMAEATTTLQFSATAVKMVENKAAVVVGTQGLSKKEEHKCQNCEKEITIDNLNDVVGNKNDQTYRKTILKLLNQYIEERKDKKDELHINTCLLKAHFLSEIATETGLLEEKLTEGNSPPYYSKDNIKKLWPSKYKQMTDNNTLESIASERPQKQLLNNVYGTKNGNLGGDDGWNYRGKGLIQLTGRKNYKDASTYLKNVFPNDYIDFEVNYDKVAEIKYAVLSSIAFWEGKSVFLKAKNAKSESEVPNVRTIINYNDRNNPNTKTYFKNAVKTFKVDNCTPVTFNAKDITTFRIYWNESSQGKIEKHIPKTIKDEFKNKYKYIYHTKNNQEIEICMTEWNTTKKKSVGHLKNSKPTHSVIVSDENNLSGSIDRRITYTNGDIAEYGKHPSKGMIWRLYIAESENIELVKMPDSLNINKNGVIINYSFTSTERRYTSPGHFAAFIGALAENGFSIQTSGSCFKEGSAFPSYDHSNGKSIDSIYLNDSDEQNFINAMVKFSFNKHLRGTNKKHYTNTTDGGTLHDSHLHSSFDESFVITVNE